ncbi:Activating Transcription Factor 7-Interacting Protein 1 [Manis pentadactyla]|nr:Activating Transcription Factor 7-Interacting Protein 1 [Manis pentadactyla]
MTDVEADDVGSGDINADAEGPGYGSLVRMLKLMVSFQGECAVECQDYSEARVISMVMVEFQATDVEADAVGSGDINADVEGLGYGSLVRDVEADGVVSETLALRKELGSGSDVTGVQDGE